MKPEPDLMDRYRMLLSDIRSHYRALEKAHRRGTISDLRWGQIHDKFGEWWEQAEQVINESIASDHPVRDHTM